MCGLFGWSFQKKTSIADGKRETMAGLLAVANSMRGNQAWGLAAKARDGRTRIRRGLGDISDLSGLTTYGRFQTLMGHTRYATVGSNILSNTHPFRHGKLTLAHNGGIWNHDELNKKYERKCEVDSQHIIMHLSEGKDFSELEGYGAIEWLDEDCPGRVFLCRLKGGSLSAFGIENRERKTIGVAWSSDRDHVETALGQARLSCFPYKPLEEGLVHYIEDGILYGSERKLDLSKTGNGYRTQRWSRSDNDEHSYGFYGGSYGGTGYYRERHGRYTAIHYLDERCEKCNHWHNQTGTKCLRDSCDCKENTLQQRDARLDKENKDYMKGWGYWNCSVCDHFHEGKEGGSCLRSDCVCTEKPPKGWNQEEKKEEKKENVVTSNNKGIVIYTPKHGKLVKLDMDCYAKEDGQIVQLDEIEDEHWKFVGGE
jgi:hypothetical protein